MSQANPETELVFYARLLSFDGLDQAEVIEEHIQLETTFVTGPRARVRKITPIKGGPEGASDSYVLTLKFKTPDSNGVSASTEVNQIVDRNFYEYFGEASVRGMRKTRYRFTGEFPTFDGRVIPGIAPLTYEVDLYTNQSGNRVLWIKIDVELDGFMDALKNAGISIDDVRHKFTFASLPLQLADVFYGPDQNEQQKALLDKLWQEEYVIQLNPEVYVKKEDDNPQQLIERDVQGEQTLKAEGDDGSESPEAQGSDDASAPADDEQQPEADGSTT